MDVELVQARVIAITSELNLKLQLVTSHGELTNWTHGTHPWPSPCPVGTSAREFAISQCHAGLLAEVFLVHLAGTYARRTKTCIMP